MWCMHFTIHEDQLNFILKHTAYFRPSMFNYGTDLVIKKPKFLCLKIEYAPIIPKSDLVTELDQFPIIGSDPLRYIDYCLQLTKSSIDFYPFKAGYPSELIAVDDENHFILKTHVTGALLIPEYKDAPFLEEDVKRFQPIVDASKKTCINLDLYLKGYLTLIKDTMYCSIQAVKIETVGNEALEKNLELYLHALIYWNFVSRYNAKLSDVINNLLHSLGLDFLNGEIKLEGDPDTAKNPHIVNNQIHFYLKME